jgi:hypothetical protein
MNNHGGARPGSGSKKTLPPDTIAKSIRLTAEDIETAKSLGNGEVTAGIRQALKLIREAK